MTIPKPRTDLPRPPWATDEPDGEGTETAEPAVGGKAWPPQSLENKAAGQP